MRLNLNVVLVFLGLLTSSALALAAPDARYRGEFSLAPKVMHAGPITGQLEALFEGDEFRGLVLTLDQPVMGLRRVKSDFSWFNRVEVAGKPQLAFVFNLQGPPHKWYFVSVAAPTIAGGTTFDATMYKVRAKVEELKNALKGGLPMKDGRPTVPAGWKPIGTGTLKY